MLSKLLPNLPGFNELRVNAFCFSGYCGHCKQYLDQCQSIPAEDFDSMRKNFLKHSLIKSDVFLNSSPEELSRFTEFLSKSEPYTVVVDGLNVMLGLTRKPNPRQQMLQVCAVPFQYIDQLSKYSAVPL